MYSRVTETTTHSGGWWSGREGSSVPEESSAGRKGEETNETEDGRIDGGINWKTIRETFLPRLTLIKNKFRAGWPSRLQEVGIALPKSEPRRLGVGGKGRADCKREDAY